MVLFTVIDEKIYIEHSPLVPTYNYVPNDPTYADQGWYFTPGVRDKHLKVDAAIESLE